MIRDTFVAFDEDIVPNVQFRSSDVFDARLGAFDQFSVMLDVRDAKYTDVCAVGVGAEQSGDGVHWYGLGSGGLTEWTSTDPTTAAFGGSGPPTMAMPFVRLNIAGAAISGSFYGARVRVYVTMRDRGGGVPFRAIKRLARSHVA
jgi:hypothetical protein